MSNALERFQIIGLHGKKNIDVRLNENTVILVGENGSGKTTFLRILFYLLSGRWVPLVQIQFDKIVATIDGKEYVIKHKELAKNFENIDRRFLTNLPAPLRKKMIELIETGQVDRVPFELRRMCDQYGTPIELIMRQLEVLEETSKTQKKEFPQTIHRIQSAIDAQILYLPTYRRIEREIGSVFYNNDLDEFRHRKFGFRSFDAVKVAFEEHSDASGNRKVSFRPSETGKDCIELVEFGMKDVKEAIEWTLEKLKEFARESLNNLTLGYLGDIVKKEYNNVGMREIADVSEETVRNVLNRIDEKILTKVHKEEIFTVINSTRFDTSPDEHSKIISHYFLKLLRFQAALQEKEKPISEFCVLCSDYIVDKQFVYDGTKFNFSIIPKDGNGNSEQIELSDLSSGEKQIVSLFSHLYLSGLKSYFVLIDEPELSLSVPWQRRFLTDIKKGNFCVGLVAVTHSPFIYDNELLPYAHSLGEFVSM